MDSTPLQREGKPHEFVVIDGDHSLRRAAWRRQLYQSLEEFLAGNLEGTNQQSVGTL